MTKIARFIIWICSKFTRVEIEGIIRGLVEVLANGNPEVKPRDDFQEKHPNYRKFSVDPLPPLTSPLTVKTAAPACDYKELLVRYQETHGKPLSQVKYRSGLPALPGPICLSLLQ
ncbi:MAG: hypothetical protein HY743_09540 [Deltaproteobacteria bacterium]|nr:hypothetical protein [Deltaproteobacteria bacterium]